MFHKWQSPLCRGLASLCSEISAVLTFRLFISSFCHPRACTPIPLILFPVPLALRWYLRSLMFMIVCLCLPAQIPPFSSDSSLLHALTHSHARTQTLLPRIVLPPPNPPRLGAVSFTSVRHPRTDSNLEQGGRGWIYTSKSRPQASLRLDPLAVQRPQARRLRSRE